MATSIVQFRVDDDLKNEATKIYEELGIDLSTAMRMFLKRSVIVNGIPFSMVVPKDEYNASEALSLMKKLNAGAVNNGVSEMTLEEINSEIEACRKERIKEG